MDPLSSVIALLNPRTYNVGGLDLGATSAIQFPQHQGMKCYAVVSGEAWFAVEGFRDATHLESGQCILLASGRPFRLAVTQQRTLGRGDEFQLAHCGAVSAYDDGGSCFIVGAHYAFTEVQAAMLLSALPPIMHLQNESKNLALCLTLQQMTEELRNPQLGGILVAHYLAKMMLVEALRLHLQESPTVDLGWLLALSDKQMGTAITCMHEKPAHAWTVEELAQRVGMSRSGFSLKFKDTVGHSPIEYLTRWRILLAEDKVRNSGDSIAAIAQSLGYKSPSAFAKVFKKLTGHAPGQYRQP